LLLPATFLYTILRFLPACSRRYREVKQQMLTSGGSRAMTSNARSRLDREQRAAAVAEATQSAALEGLSISPASMDVAAEYIRGTIDIDEAGRRIRSRYGLA
jgi:antitoxin VbhA-like protein